MAAGTEAGEDGMAATVLVTKVPGEPRRQDTTAHHHLSPLLFTHGIGKFFFFVRGDMAKSRGSDCKTHCTRETIDFCCQGKVDFWFLFLTL